MKITNIVTLAGLQAKNASDWKGKVLLYGREFHFIRENENVSHALYDANDGRSPLLIDAGKIRTAKSVWRKTKSGGKWFKVYNEEDVLV